MNRGEAIKVLNVRPYTGEVRKALETLVPELRESDDERIRHDIMEAVENWFPYERVEEIRAYVYLEKQKEEADGISVFDTPSEGPEKAAEDSDFRDKLAAYMKSAAEEGGYVLNSETILKMAEEELLKRGVVQKHELVQHPAISYMYNADASRGEQLKQAILALLKSDLIQVAGHRFTKTELIDWVETRPAEMKEDKDESTG